MHLMKTNIFYILIIAILLWVCNYTVPLYAAGEIRKLTGLSASMDSMAEQGKEEGKIYKKADALINSADIKQGLTGKDLIRICGEPVAKADNGLRWVYKPPTSTFFKGEKIYFYFDKDQKLIGWEKIRQ
jgi:hypothetical protein